MESAYANESYVTVVICFSSLKGKRQLLNWWDKYNNLKMSKTPRTRRLRMIDVNSEYSKGKEMQKALQICTYITQKAACLQNIINISSSWTFLCPCEMFNKDMNAKQCHNGFVSIGCFLTK